METVIISYSVADYDKWMSFDDERRDLFYKNGVDSFRHFRDVGDGNRLILLIVIREFDKFKTWLASDDAREARNRFGVLEPFSVFDEIR